MEIELEASLLQQIINLADSLDVTRLPLVANADGLQIEGADSGHIIALRAKIPVSEIFRKYVQDEVEKHAEAGKVQVCCHDTDVIAEVLKLAETPASILGIKTVSRNYDDIDGEVTLGALTLTYDICQCEPYKIPEWAYEKSSSYVGVKIMQKEFYNAVKTAADLAGIITLKATKDRFSMNAENVDFDGKKAEAAEVIAFADP
ncbi:MAG: hypothetical protein NTY99_02830, partial [DPANN group archaeon]|nr:hypothetical protein [DPANN group archaeon]